MTLEELKRKVFGTQQKEKEESEVDINDINSLRDELVRVRTINEELQEKNNLYEQLYEKQTKELKAKEEANQKLFIRVSDRLNDNSLPPVADEQKKDEVKKEENIYENPFFNEEITRELSEQSIKILTNLK